MIVIVDERALVRDAYRAQFEREGFASQGFSAIEFGAWLHAADSADVEAIAAGLISQEAFEYLTSTFPGSAAFERRLTVPVFVLVEHPKLDTIVSLLEAGAADVLRKPVHGREIIARLAAIGRRAARHEAPATSSERLEVFHDGRDPRIDGMPMPLPRRERRILEHLASLGERRATRAQIYGAVYGVFNEGVGETVVESHISKLRKKLRERLGYDPIDSRRFLGYRLQVEEEREAA